MTVEELIEALSKLPPYKVVVTLDDAHYWEIETVDEQRVIVYRDDVDAVVLS